MSRTTMAAPSEAPAAAQEWRAHWTIVLASVIGMCLPGVPLYTMGVFIAPLEQEFGWSRGQISSGLMIFSIVAFAMTPVAGWACDRFGARRVAIAGSIASCCGLAMLSLATGDIRTWWALWILLSLVQGFVSATVWVSGVVSFFARGRGLALAICLSGTGVTTIISPPLANWLTKHYGWQGAYQGLAIFWFVVALPVIFFLFTSARDRRRVENAASPDAPPLPGPTFRQGLTSSIFIRILLAVILISLAAISLGINIVPIIQENGLSRDTAVGMASMIGIGSIFGRLVVGFALDRFNSGIVAACTVMTPVIACALLLALPQSIPATMLAAFVIGIAMGGEFDAAAYLIGKYFGLQAFGAIFGIIAGIVSLTAGVGPAGVNYLYDFVGSYHPFLWACMPMCVLASLLFLSLRSAKPLHPIPSEAAVPAR